ncbi:MAG: hypothetical protein EBV03_09065, partial [Proteobacteria bacterium]|nr:hypothetical protein [Pseudomonadota bacterium]
MLDEHPVTGHDPLNRGVNGGVPLTPESHPALHPTVEMPAAGPHTPIFTHDPALDAHVIPGSGGTFVSDPARSPLGATAPLVVDAGVA